MNNQNTQGIITHIVLIKLKENVDLGIFSKELLDILSTYPEAKNVRLQKNISKYPSKVIHDLVLRMEFSDIKKREEYLNCERHGEFVKKWIPSIEDLAVCATED